MDTIVKAVAAVKAVEGGTAEHGEFEVILSTPTRDRDGDEVRSDEWELPLPEHITFDVDHGMSVLTTVGSGAPALNDAGQLVVRGTFASTQLAQQTRTLVNEGHIRTTSVAYLEKKTRVDGRTITSRELLNGAFVAIPANPEALIVSSKSAADAVEAEAHAVQTKAVLKAIAGSYEEKQQAIMAAVDRLYDEDWRTWAYLVGTTDDVAVWRVWSSEDDKAGEYRASYTIDDAFDVTLGEIERVRVVEVVTELPADTAGSENSKSLHAPDSAPDVATKAASAAGSGADDDAAELDGHDEQAVAKAAALATAQSLDVQFL